MTAPYTQVKVDPKDVAELKLRLTILERKINRKIIRQATRRSLKVHILPQMRRQTAIRSGYGLQGGASRGSRGRKGRTGRLAKSIKIRAIRRTRTGVGTQAISKDVTSKTGSAYYGSFVQFGRTFNMFLGRQAWRNVPESRKGRGGDLWRPGSMSWHRVATRRGPIAINSAIRLMSAAIIAEVKKRRP